MPRAVPWDPEFLKRRLFVQPKTAGGPSDAQTGTGTWRAAQPSPPAELRGEIGTFHTSVREKLLGKEIQLGVQRTLMKTKEQIEEEITKADVDPKGGVYHLRRDEYVLETMDPRHRPGRGLAVIWDFYKAHKCDREIIHLNGGAFYEDESVGILVVYPSKHFFDWIGSIERVGPHWLTVLLAAAHYYMWLNYHKTNVWDPTESELAEFNNLLRVWPGLGETGVKFLEGLEKLYHRVWKTTDKRLGWKYNPFTGDGELLHTGQGRTAFGTAGYIWTLNTDKAFYTTPQQVGRLHHTTLTAGAPVLAAGEWEVNMGELVMISGQTGHYRTPMKALYMATSHIHLNFGIRSETYNVKLFEKLDNGKLREVIMRAKDFCLTYLNNQHFMERKYQVFSR